MNHSKHEVDAQSKTLIRNAMQLLRTPAGSLAWDQLPCDVMHQALPANCEPNVEPGLVGDPYVPQVRPNHRNFSGTFCMHESWRLEPTHA